MAKPLKFHQTLNLAPRSLSRGKHRRTSPPAYSSSTDGADSGAGGAETDYGAGSFFAAYNSFFSEPAAPVIPYAGIRTGEIIGHRAWFVLANMQLSSIAHLHIWQPGETIEGDIEKVVSSSWIFLPRVFGGVYSFFNKETCESGVDFKECLADQFPVIAYLDAPCIIHAIVLGTIKMWGEVIEHEKGYRAQFAKIQSLNRIAGPVNLQELQHKYGVTP